MLSLHSSFSFPLFFLFAAGLLSYLTKKLKATYLQNDLLWLQRKSVTAALVLVLCTSIYYISFIYIVFKLYLEEKRLLIQFILCD